MNNGLFIFRRDLRLVDNTTLNYLSKTCDNVYTIFIFTPEQVTSKNKYKSNNAVQFMINSLIELEQEIKNNGGKLYTFYGDNNDIVDMCIKAFDINIVGYNHDISPYSKQRDNKISKMCEKQGVKTISNHDYYLQDIGTVLNGSCETYKKFTPFYNTAKIRQVRKPDVHKVKLSKKQVRLDNTISLEDSMKRFVGEINTNILVNGGRKEAFKLIKTGIKTQSKYNKTRDKMAISTSQLSASIKFGCVSIREIYELYKTNKDYIKQLYWRDFFANILYTYPELVSKSVSLQPKYDKIKWDDNDKWFKAWCMGKTGFPIVDAGMKQMLLTGYMHNRARLIVSSFLVKTLMIDWRKGEQYFAKHLTDYDVASNNQNWQWIAGCGADSQLYTRIFNPTIQAEKHDPDNEYINKYITEYTEPICDYSKQREKVIKNYKKYLYK